MHFNPAPPRSAFAKLDLWLEERKVFSQLTEAPLTQMEGELNAEQKRVGRRLAARSGLHGGSWC